jgi:hypothetical protein
MTSPTPDATPATHPGLTALLVRSIYSHVTPAMHHRIVDTLQHRWQTNQPSAATPTRHLRAA